jgi:signal transduction histidine kinase
VPSSNEFASLMAAFVGMQRQPARLEAEERVARADVESARQTAEDALHLRVFLRALAHDLKTPLTSLAWHAQLLDCRLQEGHLEPAAMEEGLQAISRGAAEAMAAIFELRDLTQMGPICQRMECDEPTQAVPNDSNVRRASGLQGLEGREEHGHAGVETLSGVRGGVRRWHRGVATNI